MEICLSRGYNGVLNLLWPQLVCWFNEMCVYETAGWRGKGSNEVNPFTLRDFVGTLTTLVQKAFQVASSKQQERKYSTTSSLYKGSSSLQVHVSRIPNINNKKNRLT